MTRRRRIATGVVLVVLGVLVAALRVGKAYYDRKVPNFSGTLELFVHPETAPQAVLDTLLSSGVVIREKSLRRALEHEGGLERMQAGHYTVGPGMSSMYAARMLTRGWQTPVRLTLSGTIRTPQVLARKIGAQMLADSAAVASFATRDDSLAVYGVDAAHLFCLVIPDTYQILWTASVREVFDRFRKEHDAYWTAERLEKARKLGLTPDEVSTLASIVDGESHYAPELSTIAGVYLNRLRSGWPLQADPTVNYCFGYTLNRVLLRHLEVDSPYNTYKHAGLPPGPISCPPKNCLEAVLNPEHHAYMFFCASPDLNGTHAFAVTAAQHEANARAYREALNRLHIK